MISTLMRLLGVTGENQDPKQYEPVFGLPKQSLDEWLSRHPSMKESYAAALARTKQQVRRSRRADRFDRND